jgi:hypothetical protein
MACFTENYLQKNRKLAEVIFNLKQKIKQASSEQ